MTDQTIQQMIDERASKAPRVTPDDVEAAIRHETYFTAAEGVLGAYCTHNDVYQGHTPSDISATAHPLLTICVLVLDNGFTVVGKSACASPENFDAEIGRQVARRNALNEVWSLLGFRLRDQLAVKGQNPLAPVRVTPTETWLDRLKDELRDHTERQTKLEAMCNDPERMKPLSLDARDDLFDQLSAMSVLQAILLRRVRRAEGEGL